jgi:hypothetical protein
MRAISEGKRPPWIPSKSRTGTSYTPIWRIAAEAWRHEPVDRPDIFKISTMLRELVDLSTFLPNNPSSTTSSATSFPPMTLSSGQQSTVSTRNTSLPSSGQVIPVTSGVPGAVAGLAPGTDCSLPEAISTETTLEIKEKVFSGKMGKLKAAYDDPKQKITEDGVESYLFELGVESGTLSYYKVESDVRPLRSIRCCGVLR